MSFVATIFWSSVFLLATIWCTYGAVKLVKTALKTGVLQARGRTYNRFSEPKRFWAGIVFWLLVVPFMWVSIILVGWSVLRH
jgi:hypothetical protein